MIKDIRSIVAKGLKDYIGKPVVRSNQNSKETPDFPYIVYTVTTHASRNNGTYEEWGNGVKRKLVTQIWSITSHSDDYNEAVTLAMKARDWLDSIGKTFLSDNDIVVQSVGDVTDRSNFISVEYQYSYGFDCFFYVFDTIEENAQETIDKIVINDKYTGAALGKALLGSMILGESSLGSMTIGGKE